MLFLLLVEPPINESFSESNPGVLEIFEAGSFRFGDEIPFTFRTTSPGIFRGTLGSLAFSFLTFAFSITPDSFAFTLLTFPFTSVGSIALASSAFRSVSDRRSAFLEVDFRVLSRVLSSLACNFASFSFLFLTRDFALLDRLDFPSDLTVVFAIEFCSEGPSAAFNFAVLVGACSLSAMSSRSSSLSCAASR